MVKKNILGFKILSTDYATLVNTLVDDIKLQKQRLIIAINPSKIVRCNEDKILNDILQNSDYLIPDGFGIIFASIFKRQKLKQRVTGIDTMLHICEKVKDENINIFLFGSEDDVVKKVKKELEIKYNGIKIVGFNKGYEFDNNDLTKKINDSKADILFVALGSPLQELWMYENKEKLNVKLLQGVGGSFDVISGNIKRAPKIFRKTGLEWAYRIIKQPFRIGFLIIIFKYLKIVFKTKKNYEVKK